MAGAQKAEIKVFQDWFLLRTVRGLSVHASLFGNCKINM